MQQVALAPAPKPRLSLADHRWRNKTICVRGKASIISSPTFTKPARTQKNPPAAANQARHPLPSSPRPVASYSQQAKHKIKLEGVKPADVSATLNIKTLLDLFKLIPQAPFNLKIDNLRNQAPKSKIHPNQSVPRSIPSPSTALSLTNSPLIKAVKEPASAFIPQRSIYFALSAKNGIVIPDHLRQTQAQYDDIDCGNYTPINPPSFDHQASSDNVTLASGPTSLAFGPIFANGILNASILNSHYFMEPLDCYGSALNSSPMMPSSSKDPASPSTTKHQILELIGEVKLCSPKQWMIQSGQRNTFYP